MLYIAHRGQMDGVLIHEQNTPDLIDYAIHRGFHVEVDVYVYRDGLWLGHDAPFGLLINDGTETNPEWLTARADKLFIHCKNIGAFKLLMDFKELNLFMHDKDPLTITTRGNVWVHPDTFAPPGTIQCAPMVYSIPESRGLLGVCSDYVAKIRYEHERTNRSI